MTSQDSTDKNKPARNTQGEPSQKRDHTDLPFPGASTPIESNPKKPYTHCEITCKTEKNWWDKAKPYVEISGVVLLFAYTVFAGCQTWEIHEGGKDTHKLAEAAAVAVTPVIVFDRTVQVYHVDKNQQITFAAQVRNQGNSVPTSVEFAINLEFRNWEPKPSEYDFPTEKFHLLGGRDILHPGGSDIGNINKDINPVGYQNISATYERLYFWGKFRYVDGQGHLVEQPLSFCGYFLSDPIFRAPDGPFNKQQTTGYKSTYKDCERPR